MKKISPTQFTRLVDYMKSKFGVNLEGKLSLVEGRLWSVVQQKGFPSIDEYVEYVISDTTQAEAMTLVTKLTTNYTYFMREDQHFRFLTSAILPFLEKNLREKDLRIWSAGCSSGEEPYTIAMTLDEYFGLSKSQWDTSILATDISHSVLSQAVSGIYGKDRLENVSDEWKRRYFRQVDADEYQVTDAIRKEVVFRTFNLMQTRFPFSKGFHVIFCRNVMIYFDKETRIALVNRFYQALAPGGYLFIGLSETLGKDETSFASVKPSIYKKEQNAPALIGRI